MKKCIFSFKKTKITLKCQRLVQPSKIRRRRKKSPSKQNTFHVLKHFLE